MDRTGEQPGPGYGKRGSTDKTVITMLEAAGEVQGRARETRRGEEGRENTSCQGRWIEEQADAGLPHTGQPWFQL